MPSREASEVGRAVALRVGTTIRELRTRRKLTQAQLAVGAFSVSYISAVERGKIRPSLPALSVLAGKLGVPPALLLEGIEAEQARTADGEPVAEEEDTRVIEMRLLQAEIRLAQGAFGSALELLMPLRLTGMGHDRLYALHLLQGRIHLEMRDYRGAEVGFLSAVAHGERMTEREFVERARNLLGLVYFLRSDYDLARKLHEQCAAALEQAVYSDPVFILDVYGNLASDLVELGELGQAIALYQRALEPLRGLRSFSPSQAERYMESSVRYANCRQWSFALLFAQRSLACYQVREEQKLVGLTHQCLGKALERQQQFDAAEQEYRLGLTMVEGLDATATALCYNSLAEVELLRLHLGEAERHAARALDVAESAADEQGQGQALFTWALIRAASLSKEGASGRAREYAEVDQRFERALGLIERAGVPELAARAYERYAALLEARGEVGRTLKARISALHLRRRRQDSR
jgi:transcriptional regulator with XRE-family HTH domain